MVCSKILEIFGNIHNEFNTQLFTESVHLCKMKFDTNCSVEPDISYVSRLLNIAKSLFKGYLTTNKAKCAKQ